MPEPGDTKTRLLNAGCKVFASLGFREATVAEICHRADANIAAVNYHFGDKAGLYGAVWRHASELAERDFGAEPADELAAADRLASFIRERVRAVFSEGESVWFAQLLMHEMREPSSALDAMAEEVIRPKAKMLADIVGQLLGDQTDVDQAMLCCMSVIGQCLYFHMGTPMRHRLFGKRFDDVDVVAKHITKFSLAAISAMAGDDQQDEGAQT